MKQGSKIVFLSRLYHPHIGGVEKHLEILSQVLMRKGFDITIVTEQYMSGLPLKEVVDGIAIYRIPIGKNHFLKKFFVWIWFVKNFSILKNAGVLHIHDVFYWILPLRPFINGKKIYITFHGYEGYPIKKRWIILRKISEKLSNGSICIGSFMKKWYLASPTLVSYGGVRLETENKINNDQSAVFFGRLHQQTGILEYIKAYKKIKKNYPNFKFTIVGEGELSKKIPKDVKIVKFTKNVEKFISKNRFVFVSRYLSMLEGLVARREIIAVFDNPIKKDYLLMSPFKKHVYVGANEDQIASHVQELLKKGVDRNKIEEGYDWARKQTWEKVASTYLRLWGINK